MASGRIQPGSRQWVEAMRRLSGTADPTVDMSMGRKVSRDAAIPHGMGTAALDTRLRGGGGEAGPPVNLQPPVLRLQDPSTLQYIRGVWGGQKPIDFETELEIDGTFATTINPGLIPIQPEWRGRSARIWEGAMNSEGEVWDVGAGPVRIPLPPPPSFPSHDPVPDSVIQAILDGRGVVFDPFDLETLSGEGGVSPPPSPDVTSAMRGKWGAGNETLTFSSGPNVRQTERGLRFGQNSFMWGGFSFPGGGKSLVVGAFSLPRNHPMTIYRRETGSGNITLDFTSTSDGLTVVAAGANQLQETAVEVSHQVAFLPDEIFVVSALCDFEAGQVEVWLNGTSIGTAEFSDAGAAQQRTQNRVFFSGIDGYTFRRVVELSGEITTAEQEQIEAWVYQDASVG